MKLSSASSMAVLAIVCSFPFVSQAQTCENTGVGTKIPASKLELRGCGNTSSTSVFNATNKDSTSLFFVRDDGKIGVGTKTPTNIFSFNGNATRNIWMERHTTANTAGNDFYIQAGGATSGATDKLGGNLYLQSGLSTGTGYSGIRFQTSGGTTSGTGDNAMTTRMIISNYSGIPAVGINIGNSAPNAALEVKAQALPSAYEHVFRFTTTDASSSNDYFAIDNTVNTDGTFAPHLIGKHTYSAGTPSMYFLGIANQSNDNGGTPIVKFDAWSYTGSGYTSFATRPLFQFLNIGSVKMTVNADGKVGIGTTSPDQLLSVNGDASKSGGGSWATFSDKTIKKDVVSYNDGLELIKKIKPVKFKYNAIYADSAKEFVGILAQDMQEIAPYTVKSVKLEVSEKDARLFPTKKFLRTDVTKFPNTDMPDKSENKYEIETLSYDQSAVFYMMVNAIKELDQKNLELQQQNQDLTTLLADLKKRIEALEKK